MSVNQEYLKNEDNQTISPITSIESVYKGSIAFLPYLTSLLSSYLKKMQVPLEKDFNDLIKYGSGVFFMFAHSNTEVKNTPLGTVNNPSYHFWVLQLAGGPGGIGGTGFDYNYCIQIAIRHLSGDVYIRGLRTNTPNINSDKVVMWGWKKLAFDS